MAFVTIKPNADLFAKNSISIAMESVQINEVTTQIDNEFEIYELDKITADGNAMENYSNQLNMELKHASNIKSVLHSSIASPASLQFAIECATIYLNGFNRRHSSVLGSIPTLPALESSSSLSMKTNHAIALEGVIGDAISAIIDGISKVLKWITDSIKKLLGFDSAEKASDSAKEAGDKLSSALNDWNEQFDRVRDTLSERIEIEQRYVEIVKSIKGPVPSMEVEFYSLNNPVEDEQNKKMIVPLLQYRSSLDHAINKLGKGFKLEKIKLRISVSPEDYKEIQEYLSDLYDIDEDTDNQEQDVQLADGLKPEQYGTTFVAEGDKMASITADIVEMAEKVHTDENAAEVKKMVDEITDAPDPKQVKLSSYVETMNLCSLAAANRMGDLLGILDEIRKQYESGALAKMANGDAKGAAQEIFQPIFAKTKYQLPNGNSVAYDTETLKEIGYLPLNVFGSDQNGLSGLFHRMASALHAMNVTAGYVAYNNPEMTFRTKRDGVEGSVLQSKQYMKDGAFTFQIGKTKTSLYPDDYAKRVSAEKIANNYIVPESDLNSALSKYSKTSIGDYVEKINAHVDFYNKQLEHFKGDRKSVFENTATELNTLISQLDDAEKLKINVSNFKPNVDFCRAIAQLLSAINVTDLYAKHIKLRDKFGLMINKLVGRPVIDVVKTPEVVAVKTAIKGSKRRKKKKK